jgi:hypothetical protein
MDGRRGGMWGYPLFPLFFFRAEAYSSGLCIHRMKRNSRRRNASGKRSSFARKKSVERRRCANRSGGRRRNSSVRCAKKWSGFNARRGIGLPLGAVAVCGVYAVRAHRCARVRSQREGAREQVRHFPKLRISLPPPIRPPYGVWRFVKLLMLFHALC